MLAAVDVSPHGERIQRDISQFVGIGDIVAGEHPCQVVTVAPTRLAAGALDALPVVDRTRIIREVDHLQLGFFVHGGCRSFVVRSGVVGELALLRRTRMEMLNWLIVA